MRDSRELIAALRRLVTRRPEVSGRAPAEEVDTGPGSTFEALLGQRISAVEERLEEVRGRLNGLLFVVLAAVTVQAVLRVAGF